MLPKQPHYFIKKGRSAKPDDRNRLRPACGSRNLVSEGFINKPDPVTLALIGSQVLFDANREQSDHLGVGVGGVGRDDAVI